MLRFYDFFAGAGLATLGLRHAWECVWANDIDPSKGRVYSANFGADHFHPGDVAGYTASDLPNSTQLAWASFPCQDLSLAGWRRGISAERSGAFWAFWKIMRGQHQHGARPPVIVIENVAGLLYGDSFTGLCEALAALEMQFGALVIDARRFVPQSRPRVFIVAVDARMDCSEISGARPVDEWTPPALLSAHAALDKKLQKLWRWWRLPVPDVSRIPLSRIIESNPTGVRWHTNQETRRLLAMMSETNQARIAECRQDGERHIGFLYKRIRGGLQRAEVRFDGFAGCLRTPRGGSSRQTVVLVYEGNVRTRLLSPREAARLMGVPDTFHLPEKYNDAYEAMGDAVVVPVVRWLSENLLEPLAALAEQHPKENTSAHTHKMIRSTEKRAAEWTEEQKRKRSWIMAQVRSSGTRPEVQVQRALDALHVAYSTDGKALPGNPDIVLRRVKLAVFVNGCFWHWHGCKRSRMPASNREYWEAKIARNVRRDKKTKRLLWAQGWHCCTIWECDVECGVTRLTGKIAALRESARVRLATRR